jgi:sulfoquinovosidase
MLKTQSDGGWNLLCDGRLLISHSEEAPFAVAVRQEKIYTASRGTVKTEVAEAERIPLTQSEDGDGSVTFSAGGHSLRVEYSELPHGAKLDFCGEDGWSYEFYLPAIENEAVFGGGEQYRKVNLRGETVVNFVSEHIKASTIIEKALLPKALYREKPHSQIGSYAPMPIFVTDRGRFIAFDTDCDGRAVFGDGRYVFEFDSCPRSLKLQTGGSFRKISSFAYDNIPNRQYIPDWCLDGMILGIQGGTETILEKTFAMLDAGAKICGVWSQDWSGENRTIMGKQVWWNWEADTTLYPGLEDAIKKLRERGVRFLAYINPYLVKSSRLYEQCAEAGYLIRRQNGEIYHIKSTTFDAGMLDLTNPKAVRFTKDVLIKKNMLDLGVSGWMADFGEYLPVDCVLHDGDPALLHNKWPVMWAKLNREAIEEYGAKDAMFFMRSGYLGIQEYAPILWNGDQHTDYTRDYGLPCIMPACFSLGFSGVTMLHWDIGGFFSFGKLKRDDELFTRWLEAGAFSLMMRSHESIRPWANSQFDAPNVTPHTVALTNVHAALKPYIKKCVEDAQSGIPAIRPDFWETGDYSASRDEYAYFFGDDIFVAPVIEKGADTRTVCLPAGQWRHFWSGKPYRGGLAYNISAPLGHPAVFYRENSEFAEVFKAAADCSENK